MSTKKIGFTAPKISVLGCESGKSQSIYWDSKTPCLGVRITPSGNKAFIFQTWFNGTNLRITIGDIETWSIDKAKAQDKLLQYETHMRFALKAQNQCRATLQALVQLKQPSNTTFVKQANIAQGHQQVNNLAEKNITPQNELLKDSNAQLDTGTTTTPKGIDTTLEALDKINGCKDAGRQEKVITKRLQNRQKP